MKPDKHKQKRTQQYKKKHGIKDKNDKQAQDEQGGAKTRADVHGSTHDASGENKFSDSSTSAQSDGGHAHEPEHLSNNSVLFKKRAVVSNWERYAGIASDPDPPEPKGADFRSLLEATSSAASQFRFADEKLWDEELSATDDADVFLNIDTNELADALECIPLHRRLNIEAALFQPCDVQMFEEVAEEKKTIYLESTETAQKSVQDSKIAELSHLWDTEPDTILGQSSELNSNQGQGLPTVVELGGGFRTVTSSLPYGNTQEQRPCEPHNQQIQDDLDKLLSSSPEPAPSIPVHNTEQVPTAEADVTDIIGSQVQTEQTQTNDTVVKPTPNTEETSSVTAVGVSSVTDCLTLTEASPQPVKVTSLEDELDNLLSLDVDTPATVSDSLHARPNTDNNIEDWLDSIVDD